MNVKRILQYLAWPFLVGLATSCSMSESEYAQSLEKYPNSGIIEFGGITLTIPDGYIRDTIMPGTAEGVARRWEHGHYKKIVTISRQQPCEINEETRAQIENNQRKISATGELETKLVDFNGGRAIESRIPVPGGELVYLIFNADGSGYDFSVQGDASDYEVIRNSIVFAEKGRTDIPNDGLGP